MAGNNPVWTIDDTFNVVRPDGTIYINPLNNTPLVLLGTGFTIEMRNDDNAGEFMNANGTTNFVTANNRNHTVGTLPNQHTVIYGKRLRWTGSTFTGIPTAINRHVWLVNCSIEAELAASNNNFFIQSNGIGGTAAPSDIQLTENGASSVNLLGCTMVARLARFGPTMQVGYAEDNVFLNQQAEATAALPATILLYPMNGGLFLNNTVDNTLDNVGSGFVRLGGNARFNVIESGLEGLTLARSALMYANRADATESITLDIPNYNVLEPMVFSDLGFGAAGAGSIENGEVYIATTRTGSAGNTLVGFRMRELENWEAYTYPVNGNRVTGRALAMRAGISGQEGNFRCVMTATYNPLFFDNAQAVTAAERQAAGIPNVVTNITRGFNYGASGRTVDILNAPATTNNVTTIFTDGTGRLAGGTYNPNGTQNADGSYTGDAAGTATAIPVGEGFITPYASLRPTNNGTDVNPGANVNTNGNNSNIYLYDTTFVNRSFTHIITGGERQLTTVVSPDAARATRFDIFDGNQIDVDGLLYFEDANLRPATVTMGEATDWTTQLDTYFLGRLADDVADFETQDLYEFVNYIHAQGETGTVSFNGTNRQVTDFFFADSTITAGVRYVDFSGGIDLDAGNVDWAWDETSDVLSLNALSLGETADILDNPIQGLRLVPTTNNPSPSVDFVGQPINIPLIGDAFDVRTTTTAPGETDDRTVFDVNNTMTGTINLNLGDSFLRISDDFEGAITINNSGSGTVTVTTSTNPATGIEPTNQDQVLTNATELADRGITLGTSVVVETQTVAAIAAAIFEPAPTLVQMSGLYPGASWSLYDITDPANPTRIMDTADNDYDATAVTANGVLRLRSEIGIGLEAAITQATIDTLFPGVEVTGLGTTINRVALINGNRAYFSAYHGTVVTEETARYNIQANAVNAAGDPVPIGLDGDQNINTQAMSFNLDPNIRTAIPGVVVGVTITAGGNGTFNVVGYAPSAPGTQMKAKAGVTNSIFASARDDVDYRTLVFNRIGIQGSTGELQRTIPDLNTFTDTVRYQWEPITFPTLDAVRIRRTHGLLNGSQDDQEVLEALYIGEDDNGGNFIEPTAAQRGQGFSNLDISAEAVADQSTALPDGTPTVTSQPVIVAASVAEVQAATRSDLEIVIGRTVTDINAGTQTALDTVSGNELDSRGVTKRNMTNLGLGAPIADEDGLSLTFSTTDPDVGGN